MSEELGRVLPVATPDTNLVDAARLLLDTGLRGIVVTGKDGLPRHIVSPVDVLRLFVPEYIVEDPTLARVYSADAAREVLAAMAPRVIRELFDRSDTVVRRIAVVSPSATPMEIAAELIRARVAIAHVKGTQPARFVTLTDLLPGFVTAPEDVAGED